MMTTNPIADAERYEDHMAALAAQEEAEQKKAYAILFKLLMQCKAEEWNSGKQIGKMHAVPDELLSDALHYYCDEDVMRAYNAYMVGTGTREALIKAVAACITDKQYEEILKGKINE